MAGRARGRLDFEEDPRYRIATREMLIAIVYWVAYTVAIAAVALGIGAGKKADELSYIAGFPSWFFWAAGPVTLVFCIIPYFLTKYVFTAMPLTPDGTESAPTTGPEGGAAS